MHTLSIISLLPKSKGLPGNTFDTIFKDEAAGIYIAGTMWESQEAFQSALPVIKEILKEALEARQLR